MSEPLRWGVLSTAAINEKLLAGAARSAEVDVVAVASRDSQRAATFAERWGIERAYGSYDELLADDSIDAVYVPLPNALHHAWSLKALQAGKHVLCEKPYSRHPDEVEEAFAAADAHDRVLSEGFMFRYHPHIRELVRLIRDEFLIGEVRLVVSSFSWPARTATDVRLDASLDGGSMLDVGVYCLSASRLFAGEPQTVSAHQRLGPTGVDERFSASMELGSGALAHFDCGLDLPDRSHLEVVGARGSVRVSDPWHGAIPGLTLTMLGEDAVSIPVVQANPYQLELEEFGRAVRGEAHQLTPREDMLSQARAVGALLRAAQAGTREVV
jgi:xylose dehydrogenase (NAD/NADP)